VTVADEQPASSGDIMSARRERTMADDDTGLEIELGDLATHRCPCCERASETVHGFLYDRSGATSVYFAGYTHGHPERRANMALSIGGWGEGTTPADRRAIALEVVCADLEMVFTFPPAETSPWYRTELLGNMLSPEQLSEDERALYRGLARVAIEGDPRVARNLEHG
jgi:hypothetical protein